MYLMCDKYIVRTCVLSRSKLKKLLSNDESFIFDNSIYNEALLVANTSMYYTVIEHFAEESHISARNYLKRMATRPTPYGLFSCVGLGNLSLNYSDTENVLYKKCITVDYAWVINLLAKIEQEELVFSELYVKWNPLVLDTLHYYKVKCSNTWKQQKESSEKTVLIKKNKLLEFIKQKTKDDFLRIGDLTLFIYELNNKFVRSDIESYIRRLLDAEILFSNLRPGIVNEDIFETAMVKISTLKSLKNTYNHLLKIDSLMKKYNDSKIGEGIEIYEKIISEMKKIYVTNDGNYLKVDLIDTNMKGNINFIKRANIENFANFIVNMAPRDYVQNEAIYNYIQLFLERFGEYVEIPVKELLDDNIGLGSPYNSRNNQRLRLSNKEEESYKLRRYLYKFITLANINGTELEFTDDMVDRIYGHNRPRLELPSQMEIFLKIDKDSNHNAQIEFVPYSGDDMKGKAIGRFGKYFAHDSIDMDDSRDIVELVDIPNRLRVTNVASVQHRHHQTLYLNTFPNNNDQSSEINIDDIVVGVERNVDGKYKMYFRNIRDGNIVCFASSSMLNPLSSNIYSDLSRFLLGVSIENHINPFGMCRVIESIEDIPHIPKMTYKGITVSNERWILGTEERASDTSLRKWINEWKVPQYVWVNETDERIMLDLEHPSDFQWLRKRKRNSVIISRYDDINAINNAKEYVFTFENNDCCKIINQQAYDKDIRSLIGQVQKNSKTSFEDEWTYFTLLGIEGRESVIIGERLATLIDNLKNNEMIYDFHFVRYIDKDVNSLRIRIKFKKGKVDEGYLLERKWIDALLLEELCTNACFNLFDKEIERYGGNQKYNICERFFSKDSYATMHLLSKQFNCNDVIIVLHSLFVFTLGIGLDFEMLHGILTRRYHYAEHRKEYRKIIPNNNILINEFYCYYNANKKLFFSNQLIEEYYNDFQYSFIQAKYIAFSFDDEELIMSLIHMHFNRLGINNTKEREITCIFRHVVAELKKIS